jgi:hypothetical protein
MNEEQHGQIKAEAWRTLVAVDHVDAKAADEGLAISSEWRLWRSQVRAVIRGERIDIPPQPEKYAKQEAAPQEAAPIASEANLLRERIAQLEELVRQLTLGAGSRSVSPAARGDGRSATG